MLRPSCNKEKRVLSWDRQTYQSLSTTILRWDCVDLGETTHKRPGTIGYLVKWETVPCVFQVFSCFGKEISSQHQQVGLERSTDSWVRSIFTPIQFSALGSLQNVYKTTTSISTVLDCAWSFSMFFQPTMLIFETDWLIFSDHQRRGFVFCFWGLFPPRSPQQISGIFQINSVIS